MTKNLWCTLIENCHLRKLTVRSVLSFEKIDCKKCFVIWENWLKEVFCHLRKLTERSILSFGENEWKKYFVIWMSILPWLFWNNGKTYVMWLSEIVWPCWHYEHEKVVSFVMLSLLLCPRHHIYRKYIWQLYKHCHVGILWKDLTECYQMSTMGQGFSHFFSNFFQVILFCTNKPTAA